MNRHILLGLRPARRIVTVGVLAIMTTGCTTFSQDGGFGAVESAARERLGEKALKWIKTDQDAEQVQGAVRALLAKPLSADDAVQIALLNNRGLQATYAELGIAEAALVQAGRISNPRYSLLRTKRGNDLVKAEEGISLEVIGILTLPLRTKLESRRFEQVQALVAREMLGVATETRRAWYHAVAAEERVRYQEKVVSAAEASNELARQMARAGNVSKVTLRREQVFYAESATQLARAKQSALAERERLVRLMGLYGEDVAFRLPERLPDLPPTMPESRDVEATAIAQRYDVQAARRETEGVAEALGLTKATRFISALELGRARTKEGGADSFAYGYEISLEIPLFDWGSAKVAKAEALYMQSANRLAETAINARSEVREAYAANRAAYEIARHYREQIVPLRKEISEENQLRYNGMLISVFELLADAREQVISVSASIEALRDYWLAEADLQAAMTGAVPGPGGGAARVAPMMAAPAGAGH